MKLRQKYFTVVILYSHDLMHNNLNTELGTLKNKSKEGNKETTVMIMIILTSLVY